MEENLVVVAEVQGEVKARIIKGSLECDGIKVVIHEIPPLSAAGTVGVTGGEHSRLEICVPASFEKKALEIIGKSECEQSVPDQG